MNLIFDYERDVDDETIWMHWHHKALILISTSRYVTYFWLRVTGDLLCL